MRSAYLTIIAIFVICFLFSSSPVNAGKIKTKLISLDTRMGVSQKFVLLVPEIPLASVVLFSGGFGFIDIQGKVDNPTIKRDKSFLVKYRREFAEQGLVVAAIDAPSDHLRKGSSGHKKAPGIGLDWRLSDEHMKDVSYVVNYLKDTYPKNKIFLAGQSLGTLSVVIAGIKLSGMIDGLVLSSSATKAKPLWKKKWPIFEKYPNAILDFDDLSSITVPVLVVAHEEDSCVPTPPINAAILKSKFRNSVDAKILLYSGGKGKEGCHYEGYHSYNGIQEIVVKDISRFILKNASSLQSKN